MPFSPFLPFLFHKYIFIPYVIFFSSTIESFDPVYGVSDITSVLFETVWALHGPHSFSFLTHDIYQCQPEKDWVPHSSLGSALGFSLSLALSIFSCHRRYQFVQRSLDSVSVILCFIFKNFIFL